MNSKLDQIPERPYVGATVIQDPRLFFGRAAETEAVVDNLLAYRIVLLFSPSGAGKSSLIESGVKPRLAKDFNILPTIRLNRIPEPGQLPEGKSYNRFTLSALLSLQVGTNLQAHAVLPGLFETSLADYLNKHSASGENARRTLLIFDQFEELLTADPAARDGIDEFLEDLMAMLYDFRYWALFAMREDYLAGLEPYLSYFPDRLSTHYYLKFLDKQAATEAIISPAGVCGSNFLPEAARKLVDELSIKRIPTAHGVIEQPGEYVEPVQLQVVCDDLWDRPRPDPGVITLEDVSTLANIDTALADHYNTKVSAVAKSLHMSERGIREWFEQQLISDQDIRQQALAGKEAQYGMGSEAMLMLMNAYLVREDTRLGTTWYELAHDRLIRPVKEDNDRWKRQNLSPLQLRSAEWQKNGRLESLLLRGKDLSQAIAWAETHQVELNSVDQAYLDESRKWQETHLSLLQRKATEWHKKGSPGNILLSGSDLEEAAAWAAAHTDEISGIELEFLDTSRKHEELEKRQRREQALQLEFKRQRIRSLRSWVIALSIVTIVAIAMAIFAVISSNNAKQNANAKAALAATNAAFGNAQATLASGNDFIARNRETQAAESDALADVQSTLASEQIKAVAVNARIALTAMAQEATARADKQAAENLAKQALARQLASQGKTYLEGNVTLGTLLSLASYRVDPSTWDARSALLASLSTGLSQNIEPYELLIPPTMDAVNAVDISPDGTTIAWSGSQGRIVFWDVQKKNIRELQDPQKILITSQAYSPSDKNLFVTGNLNSEILFWDLSNGTFDRELAPGITENKDTSLLGKVRIISFSGDGNLLAVHGQNADIQIWDVKRRAFLRSFQGWANYYWDLDWSPNNKYLAAPGDDNKLYIFDPVGGRIIVTMNNPGGKGPIYNVEWAPDGRFLAFSGNTEDTLASVYFFDISNKRLLQEHLEYQGSAILGLAYNKPEGEYLVAAGHNLPLNLWRTKDAQNIASFSTYGAYQFGLSFVKDYVAAISENSINVFKLVLQAPLSVYFPPLTETPIASGIDQDNDLWIVSKSDKTVILQNSAKEVSYRLGVDELGGVSLADLYFTQQGPVLITYNDRGLIQHWDTVQKRSITLIIKGMPEMITALAVSQDGKKLAVSYCGSPAANQSTDQCESQIQLWDLETNMAISPTIIISRGKILNLDFNWSGSYLLSRSSDGTIDLIDLSTGKPKLLPVKATAFAFSPDGTTVAFGTEDGKLILWDLESNQAFGSLIVNNETSLISLAYEPLGKTLYAVFGNNQLISLNVDFNDWFSRLCKIAGRDMTREEWVSFVPNEPYQPVCGQVLSATATPGP